MRPYHRGRLHAVDLWTSLEQLSSTVKHTHMTQNISEAADTVLKDDTGAQSLEGRRRGSRSACRLKDQRGQGLGSKVQGPGPQDVRMAVRPFRSGLLTAAALRAGCEQ